MKTIPYNSLKESNDPYVQQLREAADRVIASGYFILGNEVQAFERELGQYLQSDYVISCSNGLDALKLIFRAYVELGVLQQGDEVIVPANTYIASILAISDAGLKPRLIEPNPTDYNLDIAKIEGIISSKTKAIMVVHLYGRVCWSAELENIAQKYNLLVIEDNAQAIGADFEGRKTGTLGHAAGFSFYPGKNLGALGDAGAVTTRNKALAEILKSLRNYGSTIIYKNDLKGYNCRMDELQAAFLRSKLPYLNAENEARQSIANRYVAEIDNAKIELPQATGLENKMSNVWHIFPVLCGQRDELKTFLAERGIETLIHYPIPVHKQRAYAEWQELSFPITEKIHQTELSIPINPMLSQADVSHIIACLNSF